VLGGCAGCLHCNFTGTLLGTWSVGGVWLCAFVVWDNCLTAQDRESVLMVWPSKQSFNHPQVYNHSLCSTFREVLWFLSLSTNGFPTSWLLILTLNRLTQNLLMSAKSVSSYLPISLHICAVFSCSPVLWPSQLTALPGE
jgi:hypothetical protein